MISSPSSHIQEGLYHTGLFLRPQIATALQGLVRHKTIQDRVKFTAAKSQTHPNGLCEIVVRKQDPAISNDTIMELLNRCHTLVLQNTFPNTKRANDDLNRTIDVSDNDESICIVSPSNSSGRKISFKRSFSNNSPCSVTLLSPKIHSGIEPLLKRQNLFVNVNTQPSPCNLDRQVLLHPKDGANPPILGNGSPHSFMKGDNIVVKVLNNDNNPPSPQCNDDSSVVLLDVCEDAKPSAPTWTASQGPTFPLNSISQNLSKNLAVDNPGNSSENQSNSKTDQENITKIPSACTSGTKSMTRYSDVVKKPKVCTSVQPVEMFGKSKDQIVSGPTSGSSSGMTHQSHKEEGSLTKISNASEHNVDAKIKGGDPKQQAQQPLKTSPSGPVVVNLLGKEITVGGLGSERSSSSASGEVSFDDEIIIEKELKRTNQPTSLLIEDSDDDIAVCEIVDKVVVNEPMLSKKQRKKLRKQNLQNQTKPSVPSTSTGPALDYIPLSSHNKVPQKGQRSAHHLNKVAKLKMIHDKKERKSRATRWNSIQSGKVDSSSGSKPSSSSENKEKREFGGNIMNPNPENPKTGLRPVVIDASNVAIGHGRGPFSVRGLKICIKYFTDRGHKVYAFAPKYRRFHVSPEDRKALDELETQGILSFTPSRTMEDGRKVASYDDRYIVQVAAELGGVVISTDNYRDLLSENEAWRETIEQRLLMFTWVGDMLLFPNDPLGRNGPHLQDFLRFPDPPAKK